MNRLFLLLMVLFLSFSTQLLAADKGKQDTQVDVSKALSKLHYLKGKPNKKAKYYIYLYVTSTCGICHAAMPSAVNSYNELRENGAEIIMIGYDTSKERVERFAKRYNVKFPVMQRSPETAFDVPGCSNGNESGSFGVFVIEPSGVIVIDRKGNTIAQSVARDFFPKGQWKKYISGEGASSEQSSESEELGSKYAELGSSCAGQKKASSGKCSSSSGQCSTSAGVSTSGTTDEGDVATALTELSYLKGKPDKKAKYYIYLHSASWCGACCMEMPRIVSKYEELKKQGFEIILFGHDLSDSDVLAFADRYKAEFPVLKDSSELASKVPGYKKVNGIPHMIVVDRSGKVIEESHPSSFLANDQWKKYTSEGGESAE